MIFFFQAEDGIRDRDVTGVQTCALPISEDVAQEVFLRIFRSLRRWDSSRPLKPWIMGITVNRCRTWMSQRARRPELVDYLHETASSQPADDGAELVREIQAAVGDLRWEYRS